MPTLKPKCHLKEILKSVALKKLKKATDIIKIIIFLFMIRN